ncbi:hypothetical protein ASPCAL05189 [Aspergillus calidoustus]|uniref:Zn(2)-C6 fungal-type domain-containing protein n=2 Tax=Aspergillus calidoustus TaxID=454130 RepID=A0A0U5G0N0_ASPCI|nr:hypothetical protein ASPCAL05189 [Aspergillus calidoustus]
MDSSLNTSGRKWSRVRMRKACDHCRRSKSRCEKTDGSPSCIACEARGIACIITPQTIRQMGTRPSHVFPRTSDSDASTFISSRQRSKVVLYDWIYGNTRSSDLLNDPRLLANFADDFRHNVEFAISQLAKVDTGRCETDFFATTSLPQEFAPLPDEGELLRMIVVFSDSVHLAFPLFREYIDQWLTERTYIDPSIRDDIPAWASLNIVLAMGYKSQILRYPDTTENKIKCERYLKNAIDTIPRLIFKSPTLGDVEALLGMVLLMSCSLEYPLTYGLLGVAIRKARTIRAEQAHSFRVGGVVQERRARVFWVAYVLDKMTSFIQGLAPCEDDSNFDVDMPRSVNDQSGTIILPNGFRLPFGQHVCQLAVIRGRIFTMLYSSNAHYKPSLIEDLSSQLRAWRISVHPECEASLDIMEESSFSRLYIVLLLLTYHHTVITLHRADYLAHADTPQLQAGPLAACTRSARKALSLTRYCPIYAPVAVRSVLMAVFASFVTLTMHILDEPWDLTSRTDLAALQDAFGFISDLVHFNSNLPLEQVGKLDSMLNICRWHLDSAERAIRCSQGVA